MNHEKLFFLNPKTNFLSIFFPEIENCETYEATEATYNHFVSFNADKHGVTRKDGGLNLEFYVLGLGDARVQFVSHVDIETKRNGYELGNYSENYLKFKNSVKFSIVF